MIIGLSRGRGQELIQAFCVDLRGQEELAWLLAEGLYSDQLG